MKCDAFFVQVVVVYTYISAIKIIQKKKAQKGQQNETKSKY